jgi:hypothetical protein
MVKVVVALLAIASWSSAYGDEKTRTAREHFERGTTYYDIGRFADAAREYELAYQARNDPAILFNIGQAWRFAREHEKAILAFRSFLRREPNSAQRAEVEQRIAEMQQILDAQKKSQEKPPKETLPVEGEQRPVPAPEPRPAPVALTQERAPGVATPPDASGRARAMKIAGPALLGVGIASLAVGIAFAVLESTTFNELNDPMPGSTFNPSTESLHEVSPILAGVFLGVGVAAAAGGAALTALGFKSTRATVGATPVVGPGIAGFSLSGRF